MRILANIIMLATVLFLPWWVSLIVGVYLVFLFRQFYELIIYGLLMDLLYAPRQGLFYAAVVAAVLVALIETLKPNLRIYKI